MPNATGDNMPSVDESGPSSGAWIIQENDVDACASNEERLRDRNCLSFYDPQGITLIPLGSDFESEAHAPKGRLWQEPSLLKLKFWGKLRKRSQNLQIYH